MYSLTDFSIFFIMSPLVGPLNLFPLVIPLKNNPGITSVTNTAMVEATVEMLYVFPKNMIEHKAKTKNITCHYKHAKKDLLELSLLHCLINHQCLRDLSCVFATAVK